MNVGEKYKELYLAVMEDMRRYLKNRILQSWNSSWN